MCAYPREPKLVGRRDSLIAEVFRRYSAEYQRRHLLLREQRLAATNICRCRTPELGGHEQRCPKCGLVQYRYNSCRDRNCPLCQWMDQADWSYKQAERAVGVPVFLLTFTVPYELRRIAQQNPEPIYTLMFRATSQTLRYLANREDLGRLGITSVLHTWARDMSLHPHIHSAVTAGGFDGETWNPSKPNFLFSIEEIRLQYRRRMIRGLRRLHKKRKLKFHGELERLADADAFASFLKDLDAKNWIADIQAPRGRPEHAMSYLADYVRSVAISEHRMVSVSEDGAVTIKTRGKKRLTLNWEEFLRRFFLHVLPSGFRKVRHYGIYSNSSGEILGQAKAAVAAQRPDPPSKPRPQLPATWNERIKFHTGVDPLACPRCGHCGMISTPLPRATPVKWDQRFDVPAPSQATRTECTRADTS